MADGRMVKRSIATCEQLERVSFEADYLFQRCLPFLDVEGRMAGAPGRVRALVCPLRPEMTTSAVERALGELRDAGLVCWYESPVGLVLAFPGFHRHNQVRRDKEGTSKLPAPTGEVPAAAGAVPEDTRTQPAEVPPHSGSGPGVGPDQSGSTPALSKGKGKKYKSTSSAAPQKGAPGAPGADGGSDPGWVPSTDRATSDKAAPWMGDVRRVWAARFGSASRPPAQAVKALRPVVDAFGEPGMLARLEAFLAQNDIRYVDLWRFSTAPDAWGTPGAAPTTAPQAPAPDATQRTAARLWAGIQANGLLRAQTRAQLDAAVAAMVADGSAESAEAVTALWPHLKRDRLRAATSDSDAERLLADALRAATTASASIPAPPALAPA